MTSQVRALSRRMKQLTLPEEITTGSGAGATGAGAAGANAAGAGGNDSESDDSFDNNGAEGAEGSDSRDVAPCYSEQHALGRRLTYQLACEIAKKAPLAASGAK